eukprot:7986534-Alexandrium_andersonii.AAC.1
MLVSGELQRNFEIRDRSAIEKALYDLIGKLEQRRLEWDEAEEQTAYLEEEVMGQELQVKGMAARIAKLRQCPEAFSKRLAAVERGLQSMPKGRVLEGLKLQLEFQELCRLWYQRAEEQWLNEKAEKNEWEAE